MSPRGYARRLDRVALVGAALALASCRWDWQPFRDGGSGVGEGCPEVLAFGVLQLDRTTYTIGDTVTAQINLTNTATTPLALGAVVIAGRRPGVDDFGVASDGGMEFDDFAPARENLTIAAGATITVRGTLVLHEDDPAGTWRAYVAYRTTGDVWCPPHSQVVTFTVAAR
jgi:hypothetical protein